MVVVSSVGLPAEEVLQLHIRQGRLDPYVLDLPAVRALMNDLLRFRSNVTVLTGDNGCGKSTLLESLALSLGFNAHGGPRWGFNGMGERATTGTESSLSFLLEVATKETYEVGGFYYRSETQFELIRAADSRIGRSGRMHLSEGHTLKHRSHGESVFDILGEYARGEGIYLLDEPDSGLSPVRHMALLAEISLAAREGAQFIIATHSPILCGIPDATLIDLDRGVDETSFDQVEAVTAMREFLSDPVGTAAYLTQ